MRPDGKISGVIILSDITPDEEEDVADVNTPSLDADDEAEAPEPFEWATPRHLDHAIVPVAVDKTK